MSGEPLGKELRLGFTRGERTLSGLNETLARDGSANAWLSGVRAINPRDESHPASYDVRLRLASQYLWVLIIYLLDAIVLFSLLRLSAQPRALTFTF